MTIAGLFEWLSHRQSGSYRLSLFADDPSTVHGLEPGSKTPVLDRGLELATIALLGIIVLWAMLGYAGVRVVTSTAVSGGLLLEVEHANTTRAGLATPLAVRVSSEDGAPLPDPLVIEISTPYLAMYDENGVDPDPDEMSVGSEITSFEFSSVDASDFTLSFDVRLEPDIHRSRDGNVSIADGPSVSFRTRVIP